MSTAVISSKEETFVGSDIEDLDASAKSCDRSQSTSCRILLGKGEANDAELLKACQSLNVPVSVVEDFTSNGRGEDLSIWILKNFEGVADTNGEDFRILGKTALLEIARSREERKLKIINGEGEESEDDAFPPEVNRPLYCHSMKEQVICFTGFKRDELTVLKSLVHHMGGSIRKEMFSKVTHLVAKSTGGEKYFYALTFRVPILTDKWVHEAWKNREICGFKATDPEFMCRFRMKPFVGCRVCFLGFSDEEAAHMTELLIENGGEVAELSDPTCTHLVSDVKYYEQMTPNARRSLSTSGSRKRPSQQFLRTSDAKKMKADWCLSPRDDHCDNSEYMETPVSSLSPLRRGRRIGAIFTPSSIHLNAIHEGVLCEGTDDEIVGKETSDKIDGTFQEDISSRVVDESKISAPPPLNSRKTHVVKAEWFWMSICNEGREKETTYTFVGNDVCTSPINMSGNKLLSSSRARKRKRLKDSLSAISIDISPGVSAQKRRSSASDAARLSDGSFDYTASPSILESKESPPEKAKTARYHKFLELCQTETNYVGILDTIMTLFKAELDQLCDTDSPILNATELKIIFGNFPPIYYTHCNMLEELKALKSQWKEEASIGDVILNASKELLKAYPPFINFFENTREMLIQCDRAKPRFHAFLKRCQTRPQCGRQSLQDLLIRPVQRLPSINLLLNDILRHTAKSNPDHKALEAAIASIQEVMTHINEDKKRMEGQVAVFDIFRDIDNCPPHLVSSHRCFVEKCEVVELNDNLSGKGNSLVLFVFSDVIEVCKKRAKSFNSLKSPKEVGVGGGGGGSTSGTLTRHGSNCKQLYKHVELLPLSSLQRVIDVSDEGQSSGPSRMFALMGKCAQDGKEEKLYTFAISDDGMDKTKFLRLLCKQIANAVCTTDSENYLVTLSAEDINLRTVTKGTLSKTLNKFAAKTRLKVGRALSFNKTPNKIKRVVSTVMTMSPFGTPSSQLASLQLAPLAITNFANFEKGGNHSEPLTPTSSSSSSTQSRKSKTGSFAFGSIRRM